MALKEIVLQYNTETYELLDIDGTTITSWAGLHTSEYALPSKLSVEKLVELKKAGFTTEEIIELHKKELL